MSIKTERATFPNAPFVYIWHPNGVNQLGQGRLLAVDGSRALVEDLGEQHGAFVRRRLRWFDLEQIDPRRAAFDG